MLLFSLTVFLQAFLSLGESFMVELTSVRLVTTLQGSLPRLLLDSSSAVVTIPEEAASSEVTCGNLFVLYFI